MARRRNREINIFNMSLLDILCGALGAFCFMMLALLPYYKPPGTETDARKNQKKTDDLVKKIEEANKKMGDAPAVDDLRKLVEELKKQIQEIQGQLNVALSEVEQLTRKNQELTAMNTALLAENEKLKEMLKKMTSADALAELQRRIEQLQQQVSQMQTQFAQAMAENLQLKNQNAALTEKNADLKEQVRNRTPITLCLRFNPTQEVDICLEDVARGDNSPKFNPALRRSNTLWPDDVYFYAGGSTTYSLPESGPGAAFRIFVNLVTLPKYLVTCQVKLSIFYGVWPDIETTSVELTAERPWQLYGTVKKEKDGKLSFTPATPAERDALWTKLSGKAVPVQTPPVYGTPEPRPTPSADFKPSPTPLRNTTPVPGAKTPPPPPTSDRKTSDTP